MRLANALALLTLTLSLGLTVVTTPPAHAQEGQPSPTPTSTPGPEGNPPSDAPGPFSGFLPDPKAWAADVFNQVLVSLLQGISTAIRGVIDGVMGSSLNFITQTPPAGTYQSPTVKTLWEAVRTVMNAGLAIVALWGGFNLIVREQIGASYHEAMDRKAPLEQFQETWLLWGNFASKTRTWYQEVFTTFLAWVREQGHEGVLGELDPLLVRKWQYSLEEAGRSVNTVRGYLAAVKSFSRYLAEERITLGKDQQPVNLLADVKVPKLPKSRPQVYKDDELDKILAGINRHQQSGARNIAVIRLMLDGGLRLKEACSLQIDDVDWRTGAIHVRWQVAKRKKERTTYVGRKTLMELMRYRDDFRPPDCVLDELLMDQDGGPLSTNAVQCVLRRLRAKLGLKRLSAHQFRRTWATTFRRTRVGDLFDLQQEGGWEDLEVPQRFYVEVGAPKADRASVMDRLELARKKDVRGRKPATIQAVAPVQGIQEVENRKNSRSSRLKKAR